MTFFYHKYIEMYINNGRINSFQNIINNKQNKHIKHLKEKINILK